MVSSSFNGGHIAQDFSIQFHHSYLVQGLYAYDVIISNALKGQSALRAPSLSEEFPIKEVNEQYHPRHFKKDAEKINLGFRKMELETHLEIQSSKTGH